MEGTLISASAVSHCRDVCLWITDRQIDRQTETDRQTDRQSRIVTHGSPQDDQ